MAPILNCSLVLRFLLTTVLVWSLTSVQECNATEKAGKNSKTDLKNLTKTSPNGISIDSRVQWLDNIQRGQRYFTKLADGRIMTVFKNQVCVTPDEGKTWKSWPMFPAPRKDIKLFDWGGLLVRTPRAIVLVFMNQAGRKWGWNDKKNLPAPDARLTVWSMRSLDEGKTWVDAQEIYDGYCGAICHAIHTSGGNVVVAGQELLFDDARHITRSYVSGDDGKTWKKGNIIDLGGRGDHDGAMEASLVELGDRRLWMVIRTTLDEFWSAYSVDQGLYWRTIRPSGIDASSAPGFVVRLASGRLALVWNRLYPVGLTREEQEKYPRLQLGGSHAETAESYQREELSLAFSSDDGKTWTSPTVIARKPKARIVYPSVFEPRPGRLWIITGTDELRIGLNEADFVK